MTQAVSILTPVYNVSNFIERCAHSLFQQTFENIEYVFVNDCTPDDSIEKLKKVIEQYPNRKNFVKIINHEKNKGPCAARNTAIDNSSGKYIQYIDSDDWIEPDMIEKMYNKAETEQADIVVCDFILEKINTKSICRAFVPQNQKEYFSCMLENEKSYASLCNKFIRKKFFELSDCRSSEELNISEDWYISLQLYYYAKKIVKIDKAFYHYEKTNINSLTSSKTIIHYENKKQFYELLGKFLKEKGLYEKYFDIVEKSKVLSKTDLFIKTKDYKLRKKYANLYRDIELKYLKFLQLGEKTVIILTHFKFYFLAHLAIKFIHWKNRKHIT